MHRRRFIAGLAAGCLGLPAAYGQSENGTRATDKSGAGEPLTLFVPGPENGGLAALGRSMATSLDAEGFASTLAFDPRGSGAGIRSFADRFSSRGNALMTGSFGMIGASILARLPLTLDNLTPVARLTTEYAVAAVRPDSPYVSLRSFLTALKTDPAAILFGGGTMGTVDHILAAMIARQAGLKAGQLRYKSIIGGTGAIDALLQGEFTCVLGGLSELQPRLALGQLKALAVSAPQRLPGIAIPTFLEQGAPIELANWRGVFAPPGIDAPQLAHLTALTDRMVTGATWKAMLFRYNWTGDYLAGADFGAFVRSETSRVRVLLAELGL